MATYHGMCKNCGSLITIDDSKENCECVFCHCVFPRDEAERILENPDNYSFANETIDQGNGMVFGNSVTSGAGNGHYDDAKILEEHEVVEHKENVIAGIVGAMLFSLVGGLLWFILYQVNFFSSLSGVVAVVCANMGYMLFARGESKKGLVISVIAAIISIVTAWYLCLSLDCYHAFQEWYADGEINYTITYAQAVRIAYTFLSEPPIAAAYFKDLGIGLLLCGVGAFSFIRNVIRRNR